MQGMITHQLSIIQLQIFSLEITIPTHAAVNKSWAKRIEYTFFTNPSLSWAEASFKLYEKPPSSLILILFNYYKIDYLKLLN